MVIDPSWVGYELPVSELPVERGRLKFFAKAIGERDPVFTDETSARAAGYHDLPAPPTFLFAAELDSGALFNLTTVMKIPLEKLLHGEQSFTYHRPVVAGDVITVRSKISDVYAKKGGALQFIVKDSVAVNQRGEHVADLCSVLVVRA